MLQIKYTMSGSDVIGGKNKMKKRNEEDLVGLGEASPRRCFLNILLIEKLERELPMLPYDTRDCLESFGLGSLRKDGGSYNWPGR